jgi:anti-repressor protein
MQEKVELKIFDLCGHRAAAFIDNYELWFLAGDVGRALGFGKPWAEVKKRSVAAGRLERWDSELLPKYGWLIPFINKADLFRVINKTDRPGADKFKKWVASGAAEDAIDNFTEKPKTEMEGKTMEHKEIMPFDFKGNKITTITDKEGNHWFVAKEVAAVLGYVNGSRDVQRHCKYPKLFKSTDSVLLEIGPRGVLIIPESDLYRLIIKSTLPAAEEFEKWVMEEVLPAIRKTGSYVMEKKSDRELGLMAARGLFAAEREIRRLERRIEDDKPKVEAYEELIDAEGLIGLREAGKLLGVQPNKFIAALREIGMFYKTKSTSPNLPYQKFCSLKNKWFEIKTNADTFGRVRSRTYFTPLGLAKVRELVKKGLMTRGSSDPAKTADEGKF